MKIIKQRKGEVEGGGSYANIVISRVAVGAEVGVYGRQSGEQSNDNLEVDERVALLVVFEHQLSVN